METPATIEDKDSIRWIRINPLTEAPSGISFPVKWDGEYFKRDSIEEYFEGQVQGKNLLVKPSKIIMGKIPSQEYDMTLNRAGFIVGGEKEPNRYVLLRPIIAEIIDKTTMQSRLIEKGILVENLQKGDKYIDALYSGRLYLGAGLRTLEELITK